MTDEEQDRIELFRKRLKDWDADEDDICTCGWSLGLSFAKLFPPPEPKDPIEECREELMNYSYHPMWSPGEVAMALRNVFTKHFPKKETK